MHAIRYQATPTGIFQQMIRSLGIRYEAFHFIDFGSGKGRTLLLAAEYPFGSVTGVEFAPELHETAQRNIRSFRGRRMCHQIQSVCQDAAEYRLVPGNYVLYFNFPFHDPVMKAVLSRMQEFVKSSHGEIIIVNYEPKPSIAQLIEAEPDLGMVARTREYAVYRSVHRCD
jgi:16S rRNA G1207 methylase RsmC